MINNNVNVPKNNSYITSSSGTNSPDYRVYTSTDEKNYYNPTKPLVESYLKNITTMYDNRGKFFDPYLFNQKFDQYIEQSNKERLLDEKVQLYDLNRVENIEVAPYQLPLNKIMINIKDFWFNFYDNLLLKKNPFDDFDNNDFFYMGITLIIVCIIFLVLSTIFQ